jgi:hypothetical protein
MASCAAGVAIAFVGLPVVIGALAAGASWDDLSRMLADEEQTWYVTNYGGLAILISWMTLFAGRRWRAEPSWIDRIGRAMGFYWVVAALALWAHFLLVYIMTTHCGVRFVSSPTLAAAIGQKIVDLATVTMPLVALVTLVLIPIPLVCNRSRFRRLARRPGLMALCASGVAMALIGLPLVVIVLQDFAFADEGIGWEEIWAIPAWLIEEDRVTPITSCGGIAVLVSWITLMVGRQWRAKPTWADRVGRALGFCWILAAFAVAISNVLIQTDLERNRRLHPVIKIDQNVRRCECHALIAEWRLHCADRHTKF